MTTSTAFTTRPDRDYDNFNEERRVLERLGKKLIQKLAYEGREFITLDELYSTLQATSAGERNGIQWSVDRMKKQGVIESVKKQKAIYKVV